MNELLTIQQSLKAPKSQFNKFGNYAYRSCEDILEALKKPLKEVGCYLVINDSIELIGERYYVKSTVSLKKDGKTIEEATAYARESSTKKGMDESQITGATSSYSRKYALNALFCIDDTKDADTRDNSEKQPEVVPIDNELQQIKEAETLDQLLQVWTVVANNHKGKSSINALIKAKDDRKQQLQAVQNGSA